MKGLFIFVLFFTMTSLPLLAACLTTDKKNITVSWKAFKTPLKVGVSGKLTQIVFDSKVKGTSIKDAIYGMGVTLDTSSSSVNTGNPARDKKIAKFFFSTLKDDSKIKAKVLSIDDKVIKMTVSMNGVSKVIPMTYSILGNELKAKGVIDIFDFKMSKELATLNKACKALHEGKTWSDVEIELTSQFSSCK